MLWGKVKEWLRTNNVQIKEVNSQDPKKRVWQLEKQAGSNLKKMEIDSTAVAKVSVFSKEKVAAIAFTLGINAENILKDPNWRETYSEQNTVTPEENPGYLSTSEIRDMQYDSENNLSPVFYPIETRAYKFTDPDGVTDRFQIEFTKNVGGQDEIIIVNDRGPEAPGSFDKAVVASALKKLGIKEFDSETVDGVLGSQWDTKLYQLSDQFSSPEVGRYEAWGRDRMEEADPENN